MRRGSLVNAGGVSVGVVSNDKVRKQMRINEKMIITTDESVRELGKESREKDRRRD